MLLFAMSRSRSYTYSYHRFVLGGQEVLLVGLFETVVIATHRPT